jgi:hypothetical protein
LRLYLGVVNGFLPWVYEERIHQYMRKKEFGILFSFWQFRKSIHKIKSVGLHDYFSFDGPIMIDSGAYSAHHSGQPISIEDYLNFLKNIEVNDCDSIVNLDIIGHRRKSYKNWLTLIHRIRHPILPVVHFPNINLSDYSVPNIGLGGMVSSLKINEKGSVYDVAAWVAKFRSLSKQKFHGFGLGSPFHQMAFKKHLESIDWIGWRRNAAIGDCYTPEGSRSVPKVRLSNKSRRWLTLEVFDSYKPPFIDELPSLQLPGNQGWINRALWNVWMFLTAQNFTLTSKKSSYVRSIEKRMENLISHGHLRGFDYYFN